ncbi:MAG: flagellar biosynthesis protein FlhA [Planctomycetota bacterium]|jgi:flagellar biosynthesis protein FlhA
MSLIKKAVLNDRSRKLVLASDAMLGLFVVGVLIVLIIPMPPPLLDILITVNISLAILTMLITLSTQEPLELSTFPTLLLFMTLFRLALNVASTRLILSKANAGHVIQAFGDFVVSGNYVVGMVIFLILVVIQFVVITKGSNRISEVAARFTLDAMPGKQMAIDADLNTGLISTEDAQERREAIAKEADFYGSMDGASKFVRGDALAGLIITAINLVGGVVIGLLSGLEVQEALKKFALLTVGDGLVSQIPALVIATSAGIIVSKASNDERLSNEMTIQLITKPRAIGMAACVLLAFAVMPGLPALPFLCISAALGIFYMTVRGNQSGADRGQAESQAIEDAAPTETSSLERILQVDRMSIEIGYRLIYLVDPDKDGALLEHISMIRRRFAAELGIIVPPIRVKDNVQLEPNGYRIMIGGQQVGSGTLMIGHYLVMDAGGAEGEIKGIETTEPTFGLPAKWVDESLREEAEMMGYTVIDTISVLVTHLSEIIRNNAHDILSRDDVRTLVDATQEQYPTLVEDLIPNVLALGEVQRVLHNLLREKVSIRNLPLVLETLADQGMITKDANLLTEAVRGRLARAIVEPHLGPKKVLTALTLDPTIEAFFENAKGNEGAAQRLSPHLLQQIVDRIADLYQQALKTGKEPVLLVKAPLRRTLAELLMASIPRLAVLSFNEITSVSRVESLGVVSLPGTGDSAEHGSAENTLVGAGAAAP